MQVCICMHVCTHTYTCTNVCVYENVHLYTCMPACIYVCLYVHMYVCMSHVRMYLNKYGYTVATDLASFLSIATVRSYLKTNTIIQQLAMYIHTSNSHYKKTLVIAQHIYKPIILCNVQSCYFASMTFTHLIVSYIYNYK